MILMLPAMLFTSLEQLCIPLSKKRRKRYATMNGYVRLSASKDELLSLLGLSDNENTCSSDQFGAVLQMVSLHEVKLYISCDFM